jgi:lysophospholipase L1-like esterase
VAATGNDICRQDTVQKHHEGEQYLVVGDSIIRNVETGLNNMKAECFPGIRTEQLHRVLDNRDLGTPDRVIIHVGTNDLKGSLNLDYVMGEVYSLVNKAKVKFPKSKIVLFWVLRRTNVSWRRMGTLYDRYDWIARTLGVTFVDSNIWLEDWDFARDGLHVNHRGARRLSQLYSRVSGLGGRGKKRD